MLQKAVPVLPAINITDTIDFYERRLGFTGINFGNYAILKNGFAEIHFAMMSNKDKIPFSGCYILVKNIEDLYSIYSKQELVQTTGQLVDRLWNKKEFSIADNNGNIIRFGEQK